MKTTLRYYFMRLAAIIKTDILNVDVKKEKLSKRADGKYMEIMPLESILAMSNKVNIS